MSVPNDTAPRKVKLWRGNKLDQEYEADPAKLAEEFVAALDDPRYQPGGRSIEFEYRWWLSGPENTAGRHSAWDEADSDVLLDALRDFLDADEDAKAKVLRVVYGEES